VAVGELTPVVSTMPVPWALLAVAVVAAASPLLAGWTVALADGVAVRWWRPRAVRWPDLALVAAVAVALAVAASPAKPRAAWLLLAAGGAVLCVVDIRTLRLPVRLTITIGAAELATLAVTALLDRDLVRLLRAVEAAVAVGAAWFCLVLAAPHSLGLGDVWVAGLCAGLLGWSGWATVLAGQAAAWLLAVPVAAAAALTRPADRGRRMQVPLGPAIIAGAIVAAEWL
jgi:leader peptidase (prepilin peptidase)/N-methyltransferase